MVAGGGGAVSDDMVAGGGGAVSDERETPVSKGRGRGRCSITRE